MTIRKKERQSSFEPRIGRVKYTLLTHSPENGKPMHKETTVICKNGTAVSTVICYGKSQHRYQDRGRFPHAAFTELCTELLDCIAKADRVYAITDGQSGDLQLFYGENGTGIARRGLKVSRGLGCEETSIDRIISGFIDDMIEWEEN